MAMIPAETLDQIDAGHEARLAAVKARYDARIAELLRVIRYWIPDEKNVPPEHEAAWHEHMDSIGRSL